MIKKNLLQLPSDIFVLKGDIDGPNILILGGTHGNERAGVRLIEKMCSIFKVDKINSIKEVEGLRGNIFFGYGNPESIEQNVRTISTKDLNRCFIPSFLENSDKYNSVEYTRARELAPLFEQIDFLFDIHGTNNPSEPFICFGTDGDYHSELTSYFPAKRVVVDSYVSSILTTPIEDQDELGTTDSFVNQFGGSSWSEKKYGQKKGIAFAYESGLASQASDEIVENIFNILFFFVFRYY